MMDWHKVKVGELGRIVTGKTPKTAEKDNYNGEIMFVTPSDNMGVKFIRSTGKTITEKGKVSVKGAIIPAGSVCVSCIGSDLGKVVITTEECITNQQINSIVVDTERYDIDFIYYAMLILGKELNFHSKTSTAVPIVNKSSFSSYEICCPALEEQKKIASVLSALDYKIEKNTEVNENLQEQVKALFHAMFLSSEDRLSWENGTFSDLIESTLGGDWGKESPTGNNSEMVYCIRGADIPEVKAGNKGKMPTRYILPKNYAAKRLLPGDIVVEISGGSPTQSTGRVAAISQSLLDRYDKGMVCTNFCRAIKPKSGYSMFVYYYWQYLYDRNVFFSYENGTTGIKNLDLSGFITTEEIVIPPFELIQKFDDYCQIVFDQTFANGLENEQLSNLRDTLLPQLMSGELDISDIDL